MILMQKAAFQTGYSFRSTFFEVGENGAFKGVHSDVIPVPLQVWNKVLERMEHLSSMLEEIKEREAAKPEIDAKARYHLEDAAKYLDTSPSTLKRRAAINKLVILYDGKTPFVMGAEILRYAREGAKSRRKTSRNKH